MCVCVVCVNQHSTSNMEQQEAYEDSQELLSVASQSNLAIRHHMVALQRQHTLALAVFRDLMVSKET